MKFLRNLRILIFSATFGAGHVRAAEALTESIHHICPDAEVQNLDCGEILSRLGNNLLKDLYIGMLKRTPGLWGKFYYGTARISSKSILQRFLNNTGRKKYLKYINSWQPDLIICTYPTVAGVIARLKSKKAVDIPLAVVITDYAVHSQWIHEGVDLYLAGSADIFNSLAAWGVDPASIKITGIPVSPRFERDSDRSRIRTDLGLLPNRPTCLVMGGAYGVLHDLKDLCKTLANASIQSQSIVVCGRDEELYKSLDDIIANALNPIMRYGFVDNIDELMSAADIIITKAGGLTVSEALTKRLPVVIYQPIPGQEQENAAFLEGSGAGRTAHTRVELESIVFSLIQHPDDLQNMRKSAARAIPGHSAERAAQHILQLVKEAP
ncbi:MAG: glycosyltransferase, partial [Syntrophomonas sp.]